MEHKISIMLKDGSLVEPSEYPNLGIEVDKVMGVALQTEILGIIISLDQWNAIWSSQHQLCNDAGGEAQALQELSGYNLTKHIIEVQGDTDEATAAWICWDYKCGEVQWYLPSLMEAGTIVAYKDEINEVLKTIGVEDLLPDDDWLWSSSESSSGSAWFVYFSNGYFGNVSKYGSYVVRAVAAFRPLHRLSTDGAHNCKTLPEGALILTENSETDESLAKQLRDRGYRGTLTKELSI
jgi:hypothetical protein